MFAQNTVCFSVEPNPINGIAFSGFTKYIDVLDCFFIVAENSISDEKVLHAAAVAAELLDNNEDGIIDDPQTADGISDEWEPYNAILLENIDILMYALITDPEYKLPLLAPDGNYCPNSSSFHEIQHNKKLIKK
ncbi:MAG: hypothetical protein CMP75_02240 [Flavobacteriales bacterium]|nr:hypothetical protein [Flavobacteriales bacterium]|tara:strand:+ start:460 stop:861 length:402 start_codon:yes stop_codon:yes gene_type:complete